MEDVLQAVKERLNGQAGIQYVDENWGQLDYYASNAPVKWPCVLIDISGGTFSNQGQDRQQTPFNRQIGDLRLELRIANLRISNSNVKAPVRQQQYNHSILKLLGDVHALLHGWRSVERCSTMLRASYQRVRRDDGVQEYVVIYTFSDHNC